MESTKIAGLQNRISHYAEAYHHCRQGMIRLRLELDKAVELASTKERQRRVLARELAAAGLKVRLLAASVEELQKVLTSANDTIAQLQSASPETGL